MPYIDITTMRGMMPRVVTSMLPEHSAVLAEDCHFRFGVITPERQISGVEKTFTIKPKTIFHYRDDFCMAGCGGCDPQSDRSGPPWAYLLH